MIKLIWVKVLIKSNTASRLKEAVVGDLENTKGHPWQANSVSLDACNTVRVVPCICVDDGVGCLTPGYVVQLVPLGDIIVPFKWLVGVVDFEVFGSTIVDKANRIRQCCT